MTGVRIVAIFLQAFLAAKCGFNPNMAVAYASFW